MKSEYIRFLFGINICYVNKNTILDAGSCVEFVLNALYKIHVVVLVLGSCRIHCKIARRRKDEWQMPDRTRTEATRQLIPFTKTEKQVYRQTGTHTRQ